MSSVSTIKIVNYVPTALSIFKSWNDMLLHNSGEVNCVALSYLTSIISDSIYMGQMQARYGHK